MNSPEGAPKLLQIHRMQTMDQDNAYPKDSPKTITLLVVGELDISSRTYFDEKIDNALNNAVLDGPKDVDIDLKAVEYIGASGINGLIRACARAEEQGTRITVINPSWIVNRVVKALKLEGTIPIDDDGQ